MPVISKPCAAISIERIPTRWDPKAAGKPRTEEHEPQTRRVAVGEEAFISPTKTEARGLFIVEQRELDGVDLLGDCTLIE